MSKTIKVEKTVTINKPQDELYNFWHIKVGDRVVIPFTISCGSCFFCNRDLWSLCDNSNPNVKEMTGGRGPDACIDAVGMEAHGNDFMGLFDQVKQTVRY